MRPWLVVALLLVGCAQAENPLYAPTPDDLSADDASAGADDLSPPLAAADGGAGGDLASGCAAADHVRVNEVQTTGAGNVASDEFIELFNPCVKPVDLSNWLLVYRSAMGTSDVTIVVLANGQVIAGGGYLLIAGPAYTGAAKADQTYGAGKLAQAAGAVGLRDLTMALVDSVGWGTATNMLVEGSAASAPGAGKSIARTPNGTDNNMNATDFAVAATPTPRAAN